MKDKFFQIKIRKQDRKKTAFSTGLRFMQFKRMPQGFKNSPAIFQRVMMIILEGLIENCCLCYIDDILIFGETVEQHDENLDKVLKRIAEYDLIENKAKRVERVKEITFLGYEISYNKVKPTTQRSQGIVSYVRPKNKKGLQRFLGLINYDRCFIKDLSFLAAPLYDMLNKGLKFE